MDQLQSHKLQIGLMQDYCKREGLDKKTGTQEWCRNHAKQCRCLIDLGVPSVCITNGTLELMITTEETIAESKRRYETAMEDSTNGAKEIISMSFVPILLGIKAIQKSLGNHK